MPTADKIDVAPEFCAFTNLRRAARATTHLYDLVLAPTGLKTTQLVILRTISNTGEVAQCDLATELLLSLETLSRRLSSARKGGLVEMRLGEHNRRLYRLTPLGARKLAAAEPYWSRAQKRLREALGYGDWRAICGLIDRVIAAAQEAEKLRMPNGVNGD